MFCRNCGNEMNDDALFCPKCGKNVNDLTEDAAKESGMDNIKPISQDYTLKAKGIVKMAFSKKPLEAIRKMAEEESYIGVVFILVSALLFALESCLYLAQILNYILEYIMGKFNSFMESASTFGDLFSSSGSVMPVMQIPTSYDMFGSFFLVAVMVCVLEGVEIYFILRILKKQSPTAGILNVVAISNVPVITGIVLSMAIGLIFPPLVLAVYILTFIMHMVYIYKGIKELAKLEREPFWEFTAFALVLSIILIISCLFILNMSVDTILEGLQDKLYSLESGLNSLWDMF